MNGCLANTFIFIFIFTRCLALNTFIIGHIYKSLTCTTSSLGAFNLEKGDASFFDRARPQTAKARISNPVSGGQCPLIQLIILSSFLFLAQFILYVRKGGLKPHSFNFIFYLMLLACWVNVLSLEITIILGEFWRLIWLVTPEKTDAPIHVLSVTLSKYELLTPILN